jgi:DNA repair exonuclease SbcCD ATPase subunit
LNNQITPGRKPQNLESIISERLKPVQEETERLRKELEAAKNAPAPEPIIIEKVVEKPVASPELEERLRQRETELEAERKALEEKTRLKEISEKIDRENMEEHFKVREQLLKEELAQKEAEMDKASKAGLEITELQKQKDRLQFEILNLRNDLEYETHAEKTRTYFRKVASGVVDSLRIVELLNEKVLQDPVFCRFSMEELALVRDDISHMHDATVVAIELLDQLLDKIKGGLELHVVKKL